jgi:hypothetical protein
MTDYVAYDVGMKKGPRLWNLSTRPVSKYAAGCPRTWSLETHSPGRLRSETFSAPLWRGHYGPIW